MIRRHSPSGMRAFALMRHIPNFITLYWRLLRDRRVPVFPKFLLIAAIAYVIIPVDLDFLPFVGQIDDVVIVILACRWFIRLCPSEVVREHVARIDHGH